MNSVNGSLELCSTHPICRLHAAVFGQQEASLDHLLHVITVDDVRTMPSNALRELQDRIGSVLIDVKDGDPRWFQLHVMLLLRGIDVMDTAGHITAPQIRAANNVGRAVAIARDASIPPARMGSAVEWVGVGALVALVFAVIASIVVSSVQK